MPVKDAESGKCRVCPHPQRLKIEMAIARGASQRAVGRMYGVTKSSLFRHWHGHVSDERKAMLSIGKFEHQALLAYASEEAGSVLDHHKHTRAALLRFLSNAVDAGDGSIGSMVAGRLTEVNNSIGRLTGEVLNSPSITNQINIFMSPMYAQLETVLIAALAKHPQARADVAKALSDLEESVVNNATPAHLIEHDNAA